MDGGRCDFIILAVHRGDRGKNVELQAAHPWARKETLKALGDLELEEGKVVDGLTMRQQWKDHFSGWKTT